MLLPAATWDISGGSDPETWRYRVDLAAPSGAVSETLPYAAVVHLRWGVSASEPWRGRAPLESAYLCARLASATESALAQESDTPRGYVLPTPKDPEARSDDDESSTDKLGSEIARLKGGLMLVESMADDWQSGGGMPPRDDWMPKRIGADPPPSLVDLGAKANMMILAACGDTAVAAAAQLRRDRAARILETLSVLYRCAPGCECATRAAG